MNINSFVGDASKVADVKYPVLFVTPSQNNKAELEFIGQKYKKLLISEDLSVKNILNYSSLTSKSNLLVTASKQISQLYRYIRFLLLIRAEIKAYSSIHIFVFSSVSFLFQIIPLIILGKFYRKNVILEFFDFQNYFQPEESKTHIRFFLQHADSVIVPSGRQCRALRQKMVNAYTFTTKFNASVVVPRVIEKVQPQILVSAHLESIFNFNCLLEAYILVKQKYPRTEITLLGPGSHKKSMEQIVADRRIFGITFVDSDDDNKLFEQADVYIQSYHIEYLAQELLQAMAYGIPVISSPLGMVKNLVPDENILMYQFNDYSTLADNILLLIENDALTKKISEQGAKYVRQSTRINAEDDILAFYQNLPS